MPVSLLVEVIGVHRTPPFRRFPLMRSGFSDQDSKWCLWGRCGQKMGCATIGLLLVRPWLSAPSQP